MRDLYVIQDDVDTGEFESYTIVSNNFLDKNFSLKTGAGNTIYIGLHKPFYRLYWEIATAATANLTLSFNALSSTGDIPLNVTDETFEASESGFVSWAREIENWDKTTVDGIEANWIKITDIANASVIETRALNLIFSNDKDLEEESQLIDDRFKRAGQLSFAPYAVASRKEIIQSFRNSGKVIQKDLSINDINQWDLLRPEQLREASKYLTLSKVFFDVSSEVDDKYYQKYVDYQSKFAKAFDLYLLSYDKNDNGIENDFEAFNFRTTELSYL